jgi:ribonuclease J
MIKNIEMAYDLGFLKYDPDDLIELNQLKNYSDREITIITTGSQGELMSALSRIANKKHSHIKLVEGDTVIISASVIPGNEKAVGNIVNKLLIMGALVQYEQGWGGEGIHVSGHASREELKTIINLTRPNFFMPIHGEYRHLLEHAELALELNIPKQHIMVARNGEIIKLGRNYIKKSGNIPAEPVYVDGRIHWDIGANLLKERTDLAQAGVVVVILKLSTDGYLMEEPRIIHRGFIYEKNAGNFSGKLNAHLEKTLENLRDAKRKKGLEGRIKNSLQKFLYTYSGRNPVIEVEILFEDI